MRSSADVADSQPMSLRRRLGVTLAASLLVTAVYFVVWYWPLLVSLTRPAVISALPTSVRSQIIPVAKADSSASSFNYPSLGISAPIVDLPGVSPFSYEDWDSLRGALRQGVGMTYEGNDPLAASQIYITGHSSDTYPHTYSSIFAGLGQAKVGDTFAVSIKGTARTYKAMAKQAMDPGQVAAFVADHPSPAGVKQAILVTCWVPLTTRQRMVIVSQLQ
jgi:LPXTG-site transpeptidase (sortase) family protein